MTTSHPNSRSNRVPGSSWLLPSRPVCRVLAAIAALGSAAFLPAAEPAASISDEEATRRELKEFQDPTIFNRRVWLETEWSDYTDGSDNVEETLGGLWAWGISTNQDIGLRLKLPYKWHIAGGTPGDSNEHGLGDIKTAAGTAYRFSDTVRAGMGLELRMPTHADDLGDNDWRLQGIGALAWDVAPWLTFSPSTEYNHSIVVVRGGSTQNYQETYFPATFLLPHRWAVTPQYEIKVNYADGNDVTQSAKLQVAKELAGPPLGFALSIKKSFDGSDKKFQVNFVIVYHFR